MAKKWQLCAGFGPGLWRFVETIAPTKPRGKTVRAGVSTGLSAGDFKQFCRFLFC
jgi:hypothetical protein